MATQKNIPKGKGSIIALIRAVVRERYGDEGLERALAKCSAPTRRLIRGEIAADDLYPETAIAEFVSSVHAVVGADDFPRLTREVAKQQVNTVLRFLLRFFASPQQLSRNNHRLWSALHDTGKLEVMHGTDDRSHVVTISDFQFPTPEYEKAFIEYHCGVLELSGAKNVRGTSEQVGPETYRQWYVWE